MNALTPSIRDAKDTDTEAANFGSTIAPRGEIVGGGGYVVNPAMARFTSDGASIMAM